MTRAAGISGTDRTLRKRAELGLPLESRLEGLSWFPLDTARFSLGYVPLELKDGEITIIRFDGETGEYRLFAEKCRSIPGPFTQNTYVWVELENWKQFEKKVIYGPYIHHTACIYGDYAEILREACKYFRGTCV